MILQIVSSSHTSVLSAHSERLSLINGSHTETLAQPYADHVDFQQCSVDNFVVVYVHEEVVQEGSDPRTNSTDQVAPGQNFHECLFCIPWEKLWYSHQHVQDSESCKHMIARTEYFRANAY